MNHVRRFALISIMLLVFVLPSRTRADVSAAELQQAYKWFDTLGFPDIGKLPFVQVVGGPDSGTFPQKIRNRCVGFLIKDEGDSFTILTSDLRTFTFAKAPAKTGAPRPVGYDKLDLQQWARNWIKSSDRDDPTDCDEYVGVYAIGGHGGVRTNVQIFVLSRALDSRGQTSLANQLYNAAERGQYREKLQSRMRTDIPSICVHRAYGEFGDLAVSRTALLDEYREISTRFPESKDAGEARETIGILTKMVAEDKEHADLTAKSFESRTGQEQVKELIFQLRDQNGHQWSNPGSCDIFNDSRGEKSPASRLVKIGIPAVPQLIDALSDLRYTRSSPILRIADASRVIIERIAHESFDVRDNTWADMTNPVHAANVIAAVKKWWETYSTKGEQAALIEGVSRGADDSGEQAELLVAKYPDAALPAIRTGLSKTVHSYATVTLLNAAARLSKGDLIPLFYDKMVNDKELLVRVDAATHLYNLSDSRAVPAMAKEWRKFSGDVPAADWPFDGVGELVTFLTHCENVTAINELAKDLSSRPIETRLMVVDKLSTNVDWSSGLVFPPIQPRDITRSNRKFANDAIEGLLVQELLDTDKSHGFLYFGGCGSESPRIFEASIYSLSTRWPAKYGFKANRSQFEHDSLRLAYYNIWARANGKALVKMPVRTTIVPTDPSVINPALNRLIAAKSSIERKVSAESIERMGLPALQAVCKRVKAMRPGEPGQAVMDVLSRRLACVVRTTHGYTALSQLDPSLLAELGAMEGKPLTSAACLSLFTHVTGKLSNSTSRIALSVNRDNDGSGIQITLELPQGKPSALPANDLWNFWNQVSAGAQSPHSGGGGSIERTGLLDYVKQESGELAKAIQKALDSPPLQPIEIDIELNRKQ